MYILISLSNFCPLMYIFFHSSDGKFRYKYVGCYRDNGLNRALPLHYFNARKYVNWHMEKDYNFKEVIDMCAVHARNRSDLTFFGVQHYGECWGGGAGSFYNRFGKSKDCLEFPGVPGVGKSWTNAVYKIMCKCPTFMFLSKAV